MKTTIRSIKTTLTLLGLMCTMHLAQAFYMAEAGRWINRDPIGEAGGISQYGFVQNDPINMYDQDGLLPGYCIPLICPCPVNCIAVPPPRIAVLVNDPAVKLVKGIRTYNCTDCFGASWTETMASYGLITGGRPILTGFPKPPPPSYSYTKYVLCGVIF